jgi:hypothetical protein
VTTGACVLFSSVPEPPAPDSPDCPPVEPAAEPKLTREAATSEVICRPSVFDE